MDFRSSTHGFVIMNFPVSNLWVSLQWFLPFSIKSCLLKHKASLPLSHMSPETPPPSRFSQPAGALAPPRGTTSMRGGPPLARARPCAPLRAPAGTRRRLGGQARPRRRRRPGPGRYAPPPRPAIHRRGWPTAPKSVLLVRRRAPEGRGQLLRQEAAA